MTWGETRHVLRSPSDPNGQRPSPWGPWAMGKGKLGWAYTEGIGSGHPPVGSASTAGPHGPRITCPPPTLTAPPQCGGCELRLPKLHSTARGPSQFPVSPRHLFWGGGPSDTRAELLLGLHAPSPQEVPPTVRAPSWELWAWTSRMRAVYQHSWLTPPLCRSQQCLRPPGSPNNKYVGLT